MRHLPFLLLLLTTPAAAEDVSVPVEPPRKVTLEFEEQWRTDPYSDEYLMGNINDVVVDDEGNFYFLDSQLQEVFKFDAEGHYLATVAHEGEGPGELSQTWQIDYWPPDALILPRAFPPKIIRLAEDGTPLEELHIYRHEGDDTQASVGTVRAAGDRAVVGGSLFSFSEDGASSTRWIGVIDREGRVLHEFDSRQQEISSDPLHQVFDEGEEFWAWNRWTVSPEGAVFCAPDREQWTIERYDLEGDLVATFRRDIEARPRTDDEIVELKDSRTFVFNGQKAETTYKLLDTEPPIDQLAFVDGHLWVWHNPADGTLPDGVWRRASVLTPDGELVEEVDLAVDYDPDLDDVRILPDGRVMVIENGVAANQAALAAFGLEQDESLADAEPAEIVIYAPIR